MRVSDSMICCGIRINSTANHAITYINCTWEFPISTHACVITLCSQPSLNNVGLQVYGNGHGQRPTQLTVATCARLQLQSTEDL